MRTQTQFEQLKRWRGLHYWVGILTAMLAALAGAGGLAKFHIWWLPPLLALATAALGAVLTTLNPAQKGRKLEPLPRSTKSFKLRHANC